MFPSKSNQLQRCSAHNSATRGDTYGNASTGIFLRLYSGFDGRSRNIKVAGSDHFLLGVVEVLGRILDTEGLGVRFAQFDFDLYFRGEIGKPDNHAV